MVRNMNISIVVQRDGDEYFAFCPEIKGCRSRGDTYDQAMDNLKDSIREHLSDEHGHVERIEFREDLMDVQSVDKRYIN